MLIIVKTTKTISEKKVANQTKVLLISLLREMTETMLKITAALKKSKNRCRLLIVTFEKSIPKG